MDKNSDYEYAFPRPDQHFVSGSRGMTLRDYFAAKALSGLIGRRWEDATGKVPEDAIELWAIAAYATADAMLEQREK